MNTRMNTGGRSTEAGIARAAERLLRAAADGVPCAPVRDLVAADDLHAAYAVQSRLTAARRAAGRRVVGRKIGITSPVVQRQLGVDQPDLGVLFDDMAVASGAVTPLTGLLQPRIEAEVAFVLGEDLVRGPLDLAQVRAAVAEARAALEIVDSRIADWDIALADTVADNGSSARYVLADTGVPLAEVEPREVTMTMWRGEEPVSAGRGTDCLGDPLAALVWLARTARELGVPLNAGEVVLSGALGPMVPVRAGDRFWALVSGLGRVEVGFGVDGEAAA